MKLQRSSHSPRHDVQSGELRARRWCAVWVTGRQSKQGDKQPVCRARGQGVAHGTAGQLVFDPPVLEKLNLEQLFSTPAHSVRLGVQAIDYFNAFGGGGIIAGGLAVFAAGNSDSDEPYYPAFYEGAIAVAGECESFLGCIKKIIHLVKIRNRACVAIFDAATNDAFERYGVSNFGDWIDIAAPGVNILSTVALGDGDPRYGASRNYMRMTGTSFSTAVVSGLLGLMVSYEPGLTREQYIECLKSTAENISSIPLNQGGHTLASKRNIGARTVGRTVALSFVTVFNRLSSPISLRYALRYVCFPLPVQQMRHHPGRLRVHASASSTFCYHLAQLYNSCRSIPFKYSCTRLPFSKHSQPGVS
eukprot:2033341-Pleurochrysis_carterae.AAC.2